MRNLTAALGLAAAASLIFAGAASASTPHLRTVGQTYQAFTVLTDRPDSGGGGNTWAYDALSRTLAITQTGPGTFTATVSDSGSFAAIGGALTPNQGAPYTGDVITGTPSGSVTGQASYSFTASSEPSNARNLGVPMSEDGAPGTFAQTTSGWYEQAFPSGTVFGGTGITTWGWDYMVQHPALFPPQAWADTSSNGDGQLPPDGNVSG